MTNMDIKEILRRNPQVDVKRAEVYARYVHELRRAGMDLEPKYKIAPALSPLPSSVVVQNLGGSSKNNSR